MVGRKIVWLEEGWCVKKRCGVFGKRLVWLEGGWCG